MKFILFLYFCVFLSNDFAYPSANIEQIINDLTESQPELLDLLDKIANEYFTFVFEILIVLLFSEFFLYFCAPIY